MHYHCILINSNGEVVTESYDISSLLDFYVDTSAIYYIHAYDGTCALESSPINITAPGLDLGDDVYACNGANYTVSDLQVSNALAAIPGVSFLWSDNQTDAQPTFVAPTTSTSNTYSVTVTYTNSATATCTLEDEFKIYGVACCSGGDATFDGGSLDAFIANTDIAPYVNVNSNGTVVVDAGILGTTPLEIVINGKLFITANNLRLINCHVTMSEAAELVVDRHLVLTLQGTIIEACTTKMWKGVRLMESATIKVEPLFIDLAPPDPDLYHYNEINDAKYAISARDMCPMP